MEYKKFGGVYAVRMDKGEEILAKLKEFAVKENVILCCRRTAESESGTK